MTHMTLGNVPPERLRELTTECYRCGGMTAAPHVVWLGQMCPDCAMAAKMRILFRISNCHNYTVEFFADDFATFKLNLYVAWQKYYEHEGASGDLHVSGGTGDYDWVDAGWGEMRDAVRFRIWNPQKIPAGLWVEAWRRSIAAHTGSGQFNRFLNDLPGKILEFTQREGENDGGRNDENK